MHPAIVSLLGPNADFYPHQLENCYPRILEQVLLYWGSEQLEAYIAELAVDERGDRQGFPPEVASELFALQRLHQQQFPPEQPEPEQAWDHIVDIDYDQSNDDRISTRKEFFHAVETGNTLRALVLLKSGVEIESRDELGKTALIWAATLDHLPLVGLLLSRSANTEAQDDGGFTALHWAAAEGHLQAMSLLLEHGAQLNSQTKNGMTPLMQAATRGQHAVIRLLLEAGADLQLADLQGQTALMHALQTNHYRSSETLLLQLTKQSQRGTWVATALQMGLTHSNPAIRQLFTRHRFELQNGL
ncbi:ankyrin repeat domain-containing protein [Chitinibacter sp. ZOR0017]|uniref:ankyrin repeat domain-containing protein n=1 Tax=Chitinibacter sp. ZOR0017 TaxID=1339254 RepID=UPI000691D3DE|nr:ankyrin repeat domain-containing protein [Chitinibacter sp. ZOR0017]